MPVNKDSLLRYISIDIRLRKMPYSTLLELTEYCNKNLQEVSENATVSKETIKKDLHNLNKIFGAPVIYDKALRAYKYSIENYTLFKLSAKTIEDLLNFIKIKFMIESDSTFVDRVQFETSTNKVDYSLLITIYNAIKNKNRVRFIYKKEEHSDARDVIFEPYLLKENRNIWYLLGKVAGNKEIRTYSLQRIGKGMTVFNEHFEIDFGFNAKTYFEHSIGITAQFESPAVVHLKFKPEQKKFLLEKPIHASQKILKDVPEEFVIQLHVEPTYELIANILSYGNKVEVLKPDSLRDSIKKILQESISYYTR